MEKTEELRQNWHITEMQHTWKARRALAKKNATDAIAKAKAEKEEKIKYINDLYDAGEARIMQILNDELLAIAREQDDYMDRFRNYAASLPKDQPDPYNVDEE